MQFNGLLKTADFIDTLDAQGYIRKDSMFRVNKKPFSSHRSDALLLKY
jgi:hypothetical protein